MSDGRENPSTSTPAAATAGAREDAPTVASHIPFAELAGFLEKVQKKHGGEAKKQMFREFLNKWREFHKHLHEDDPTTVMMNCVQLICITLVYYEEKKKFCITKKYLYNKKSTSHIRPEALNKRS